MNLLIGPLIGAAAALAAVFAREIYARFRDRRSLAVALLGEVELLLKAISDDRGVYERFEKLLRTNPGRTFDETFMGTLQAEKGALEYRVSIYEKCVGQIGQLDPEVARGLVRFFYFVDGVRDSIRPMIFNTNLTPDFRIAFLSGILKTKLPEGIKEGRSLHALLETHATEGVVASLLRRISR